MLNSFSFNKVVIWTEYMYFQEVRVSEIKAAVALL